MLSCDTLLMHSGGRPTGSGSGAGSPADPTTPTADSVNLHSCQTLYDSLLVAFGEDRDLITAQARNLAAKPGVPMVPLAMDAALMQFRRLVDERIAAERG